MKRPPARGGGGGDSVFRTIDVVGDAWSWLVLREAIFHDVRRFNELRSRLGIARGTLKARLEQLTAGGLLECRPRRDGDAFFEYALTERGRDFFSCLVTAMRWGDHWCARGGTRPLLATHRGCGGRFEAVLTCSACGERLDPRAVEVTGASRVLARRRGAPRHRAPSLHLLDRERPCSIARTLMVIGDRWSALVIRESFLGTRRFEDFGRRLGIAPNILSQRLSRLVRFGVLTKRTYQSRPRRHEYRLSKKGLDLYHVPLAMLTWGDRWLSRGKPRLLLEHRSCGRRFTAILTCGNCADPVERADIVFTPVTTARRAAGS